jgi:hypothetical protein
MTGHAEQNHYDEESAARTILSVVNVGAGFPQGEPQPIAVTMTDEQWNAVKTVLSVGLIIQATEGTDYMPDWLAEQAHRAWHEIHDQVKEVINTMIANHLREQEEGNA